MVDNYGQKSEDSWQNFWLLTSHLATSWSGTNGWTQQASKLVGSGPMYQVKGKKVKVGFLYSATYTANQNSALHNLGSGS